MNDPKVADLTTGNNTGNITPTASHCKHSRHLPHPGPDLTCDQGAMTAFVADLVDVNILTLKG